MADVMARAAESKAERAMKHFAKVVPPGGSAPITSKEGIEGFLLEKWLDGRAEKKYNFGDNFPESVRIRRKAVADRFFAAKAKMESAVCEMEGAVHTHNQACREVEIARLELALAATEKAHEHELELARKLARLDVLEAEERQKTRCKLRADSERVWGSASGSPAVASSGSADANGLGSTPPAAAPKVFRLTGMSAESVSALQSEVSQQLTSASEYAALNRAVPSVVEGVAVGEPQAIPMADVFAGVLV